MMINWVVKHSFITKLSTKLILLLSRAASTSSRTKKGVLLAICIANIMAKAAIVFSPPERLSISLNLLFGGMQLNITPPLKGSNWFSRLRVAVPPAGFLSDFVNFLYRLSIESLILLNASMNFWVRDCFILIYSSSVFWPSFILVSISSSNSFIFSSSCINFSFAFKLGL